LDEDLSQLFFDTVSLITGIDEFGNETDGLGYYRYRAIESLAKAEDKKMYGNVESISSRLSAIMRTLLVKRLESSFYAFTQSMSRFQKAIDNMLMMFDENRIFIAPDLDINSLLEEGLSYDEIENKINDKGGNNRAFSKDDFKNTFVDSLKQDKEKVDDLIGRWSKVKKDPKLTEFTERIRHEFFKPDQNISGKLVIFSESKETTQELASKLAEITTKKVLQVSAENRKQVEEIIRDNFDANLEEDQWLNDYDIIVTTEVLAEGINLHRSNVIVNYDVPWNSTRLMQRIGRVNRIGSRADKIYVYNFYPSAHGDAQIHLVNNALRKLQAFHTAFGEDNKVFSILEEKGEGALFGNKIQKEESEILKYLNELRDFKKKHPKIFDQIAQLPNKARCGRKVSDGRQLTLFETETGEMNYPLQNTSLTYLKGGKHPGIFCLITPEMNILELNFLQAVKLFKASEDEKAIALHELHHQQTLAGLAYFKSEKNLENIQTVSRKNLSPAENKAITNLTAILKFAPTEQKRNTLLRALDIIRKGTYASKGLPKSINDYFSAHADLQRELDKFIDQLFLTVLDKYNLSSDSQQESYADNTPREIINPQIVITESFS
jgi:superfamily II DNA/RNA helicase